jgi:hypothetical protein
MKVFTASGDEGPGRLVIICYMVRLFVHDGLTREKIVAG